LGVITIADGLANAPSGLPSLVKGHCRIEADREAPTHTTKPVTNTEGDAASLVGAGNQSSLDVDDLIVGIL
jgi:hypothetical protein